MQRLQHGSMSEFEHAWEHWMDTGQVGEDEAEAVDLAGNEIYSELFRFGSIAESGSEVAFSEFLSFYRFMRAVGAFRPGALRRFEEAVLATRGFPLFNQLAHDFDATSWRVTAGAEGLRFSFERAPVDPEEYEDYPV